MSNGHVSIAAVGMRFFSSAHALSFARFFGVAQAFRYSMLLIDKCKWIVYLCSCLLNCKLQVVLAAERALIAGISLGKMRLKRLCSSQCVVSNLEAKLKKKIFTQEQVDSLWYMRRTDPLYNVLSLASRHVLWPKQKTNSSLSLADRNGCLRGQAALSSMLFENNRRWQAKIR